MKSSYVRVDMTFDLLSMDEALVQKVRALLDKHIVMDDVEVVDCTELGELGLYGEPQEWAGVIGAEPAMLEALAPYHHRVVGDVRVARDPSLGGFGFRVFGARSRLRSVAEGTTPLGPEAREIRRVEAGTARYGLDLDEERLIVEANLEDAISFDKGCYLGQEVVVRATARGRVNRRLMGLVLDRPSERGRKLASAAQPDAGTLTSVVVSDRFGPIALGYVHRAAIEAGEPLRVEGDGQAVVVPLPFDREAVEAAQRRISHPSASWRGPSR